MKPKQLLLAVVLVVLFAITVSSELRELGWLRSQIKAELFSKTKGKILVSDVISHEGSKSTRYIPRLTYEYEVGGIKHQSTRFRYARYSFTEMKRAQEVVDAHPAGSDIEVFYNPDLPSDSVLSPGISNNDISGLFFMALPLGIFGFFASALQSSLFVRDASEPAGGQRIISEGARLRVRLPTLKLGLMATISYFIVATCVALWSSHTSIRPVLIGGIGLGLLIAIPCSIYFWGWNYIASGKQDLVIDDNAKTLELPQTFKRKSTVIVPFSGVSAISLAKIKHQGRYSVWYTAAPTLNLQDDSTERLADLNTERAQAFAAWLSNKIGAPISGDGV